MKKHNKTINPTTWKAFQKYRTAQYKKFFLSDVYKEIKQSQKDAMDRWVRAESCNLFITNWGVTFSNFREDLERSRYVPNETVENCLDWLGGKKWE